MIDNGMHLGKERSGLLKPRIEAIAPQMVSMEELFVMEKIITPSFLGFLSPDEDFFEVSQWSCRFTLLRFLRLEILAG